MELFYAVKRKILIILAVAMLGGYTLYFMDPTYTSTSSVLILSKETTLTSLADLQLGSQLASDYQVLIKSTTVMENSLKKVNKARKGSKKKPLDLKVEDLKKITTINNPADTRILDISVEYTDPEAARELTDAISEVSSAYVGDKMEIIPPKIIEKGKVPTVKTSPSVKKNHLLGFLAGFVLAVGLVCVKVLMDDSIKSEEDFEKYLGIPCLASIPDRKDYITKKKNKRRKEGKRMKRINIEDIRKQDFHYAEAIKTLQTNIQFAGKSVKTILITSCYPNEGKSDIIFSLAKEMAAAGKHILLLDADIRKSSFISRFRVQDTVYGLSQYLSGQIGPQDLMYATNFKNMDMIFPGLQHQTLPVC